MADDHAIFPLIGHLSVCICWRFFEFIVALSNANKTESLHVLAERIVERIAHITLPHDTENDAGNIVGASMGVVFCDPGQYSAEELIQISDKLMYEAKVAGKGRCFIKPIPPRT